jgi:hypothetical protein
MVVAARFAEDPNFRVHRMVERLGVFVLDIFIKLVLNAQDSFRWDLVEHLIEPFPHIAARIGEAA